MRYLADGGLDSSFGIGGKIFTNFGAGDNTPTDLALQKGGEIVVVGGYASGTAGFTLARYTNGSVVNMGYPKAGYSKSMTLNKVNGNAILHYGIEKTGRVSLELYDAKGKILRSSPSLKASVEVLK